MNKATIFQAAIAAIVVGMFLLLSASTPRPPVPGPTTSWRPATESEERQRDRELLEEELDRLWEKQHR